MLTAIAIHGTAFPADDDGLAAASAATNLPVALLRALVNRRQVVTPSVSALTSCVRRFCLERMHDYTCRMTDLLPAASGTAMHAWIAANARDDERECHEVPVWATLDVDGTIITITGTLDYHSPDGTVYDFKTTKYLRADFTPPTAHIRQVQAYAWMRTQSSYLSVTGGRLVYLAPNDIRVFDVPLADDIEVFLRSRLAEWRAFVRQGVLPPPVPALASNGTPCRYCPLRSRCEDLFEHGE